MFHLNASAKLCTFFLFVSMTGALDVCCGQATVEEVQVLYASDGSGGPGWPDDAGDLLGGSVSISGGIAVVGAGGHNSLGLQDAGAVYVFYRAGAGWIEGTKLVASDAAAGDAFGSACAISGDTIVVGAGGSVPGGSVYVFVRQGSQWHEQAKLLGTGSLLGLTIAVDGDTFVASADNSVHVFARQGSTWSEQAVFDPGLPDSYCFGCSIAIKGELIAVGAQWDYNPDAPASGSTYVYARVGTNWSQVARLTPDDGSTNDAFGTAVGIGPGIIAVGAPSSLDGAVYVFREDAVGWFQETTLRPQEASGVGKRISLCGDVLVSSASAAQVAFVFGYDGVAWQETGRLEPFNDHPLGNLFGSSVSVDANQVLVGAPFDDTNGNQAGAAFLYSVSRRAGTAACFGITCPCGNTDPSAGCANSTGVGGLLVGTGSRSVSCENSLEFMATQLPHPTSGLLYMGDTAIAAPLLDGIQCAGGTTYRLTGLMQTADGVGAITFGPGVLGASADLIDPGETWHFQAFYRDAVGSPCGAGANLTNAYSVTFLP